MSRSVPSTLASVCLALVLSPFPGGPWTQSNAPEPVGGSRASSPAMPFPLYVEVTPEACAASPCQPLIAASGMITADTPRQFTAFVRDNALQAAQGARRPGQP